MRGRRALNGVLFIGLWSGSAAWAKGDADVTVYLTASEVAAPYPAEALASSMFQAIGVKVAWRSGEPKGTLPGITIKVHLAVDTPASVRPGVAAFAYPYAGVTKAITVFYDRVKRRASETQATERILLAHVLVHEITHVIQRTSRHSETGIMKEHWTDEDYAAMARKPLPFSPEDIDWIRRGLEESRK